MAQVRRHRLIISNQVSDSGRVVPHDVVVLRDERDTWPADLYEEIIRAVRATVAKAGTVVTIEEIVILLRLIETVDENAGTTPSGQQSTADATTQSTYDDKRDDGDQQAPRSGRS